MTKELWLDIDMPPSVNSLYTNVSKRGRIKTTEYKGWLDATLPFATLIAATNRLKGEVTVDYFFELGTSFRGDICNRIKPVEDLLVKAGFIADDNHRIIAGGTFHRTYIEGKKSKVRVRITQVKV